LFDIFSQNLTLVFRLDIILKKDQRKGDFVDEGIRGWSWQSIDIII